MRGSRSCNDPGMFRKVKDSISMQQAADYYGLKVDRKGLCLCPFHSDTHPSLKMYPDGKGFYCFVCGAGGDVIKFAALLRGVGNTEAAKELAEAFGVPLAAPASYREKRQAGLEQKRRQELSAFTKRAKMYLAAYRGLLCEAIQERNAHFTEALQNITYTEYLLDCLEKCPEEVYSDRKAVGRIGEIEGRIAGWYFLPGADRTVSG